MGAKSSRIARRPAVVEARRIAAEFNVSAEDVRKTVTHFVQQMGTNRSLRFLTNEKLTLPQEDGLAKDGDTMIPSFVTALPTGTEKVIVIRFRSTTCHAHC